MLISTCPKCGEDPLLYVEPKPDGGFTLSEKKNKLQLFCPNGCRRSHPCSSLKLSVNIWNSTNQVYVNDPNIDTPFPRIYDAAEERSLFMPVIAIIE